MVHTDSTNSKSGEIPEVMRWLYRMFLCCRGMVTGHKTDFSPWCGLKHTYEIAGVTPEGAKITMNLVIDEQAGLMDARIEQSRDVIPVYALGQSEPVEYLSKTNWKNLSNNTDGQEYKKVY